MSSAVVISISKRAAFDGGVTANQSQTSEE